VSQKPGNVCQKLTSLTTEMLGLFVLMQQPATVWLVHLDFNSMEARTDPNPKSLYKITIVIIFNYLLHLTNI
jgi:hypothetical protein